MKLPMDILLENATTLQERRTIFALTENDQFIVNNAMINNLYMAAVEKGHVDFEDIPNSKGDLTAYSGYKNMADTITLLKDISAKSNVKIKEVDIIDTAMRNLITYRDLLTKGFLMDKQFVIMLYNTLVYACVEAISVVISSYIDFIKKPDKVEFTLIANKHLSGNLCVDNLAAFNQCVKSGEFSKTLTYILKTEEKQGFVGVDDVIIPVLIIGGLVLLVPIIRELIFYFYYTRMKISEYTKQQISLLEINKSMVSANANLSPKQKSEILAKQEDRIKLLQNINEKIQVNHKMTQSKTLDEVKQQDKTWKISDIEVKSPSDNTGIQIL